jgi:hypothetical protein
LALKGLLKKSKDSSWDSLSTSGNPAVGSQKSNTSPTSDNNDENEMSLLKEEKSSITRDGQDVLMKVPLAVTEGRNNGMPQSESKSRNAYDGVFKLPTPMKKCSPRAMKDVVHYVKSPKPSDLDRQSPYKNADKGEMFSPQTSKIAAGLTQSPCAMSPSKKSTSEGIRSPSPKSRAGGLDAYVMGGMMGSPSNRMVGSPSPVKMKRIPFDVPTGGSLSRRDFMDRPSHSFGHSAFARQPDPSPFRKSKNQITLWMQEDETIDPTPRCSDKSSAKKGFLDMLSRQPASSSFSLTKRLRDAAPNSSNRKKLKRSRTVPQFFTDQQNAVRIMRFSTQANVKAPIAPGVVDVDHNKDGPLTGSTSKEQVTEAALSIVKSQSGVFGADLNKTAEKCSLSTEGVTIEEDEMSQMPDKLIIGNMIPTSKKPEVAPTSDFAVALHKPRFKKTHQKRASVDNVIAPNRFAASRTLRRSSSLCNVKSVPTNYKDFLTAEQVKLFAEVIQDATGESVSEFRQETSASVQMHVDIQPAIEEQREELEHKSCDSLAEDKIILTDVDTRISLYIAPNEDAEDEPIAGKKPRVVRKIAAKRSVTKNISTSSESDDNSSVASADMVAATKSLRARNANKPVDDDCSESEPCDEEKGVAVKKSRKPIVYTESESEEYVERASSSVPKKVKTEINDEEKQRDKAEKVQDKAEKVKKLTKVVTKAKKSSGASGWDSKTTSKRQKAPQGNFRALKLKSKSNGSSAGRRKYGTSKFKTVK